MVLIPEKKDEESQIKDEEAVLQDLVWQELLVIPEKNEEESQTKEEEKAVLQN